MSDILEHALKLDFGNRLQVFETEYRVMEGLTASFPVELDAPDVEALNQVLMKQNRALIEQLAICHGAIHSLTDTVLKLQQKVEAQAEAQVEAQVEAQAPGPRIDRYVFDFSPLPCLVLRFSSQPRSQAFPASVFKCLQYAKQMQAIKN